MADMNNTADRALSWDDEFTNEQRAPARGRVCL